MTAPANSPVSSAVPAFQLARIGRQLLLVPEAVLLLALLCLHAALGSPPLLALAGLLLTAFFLFRTALLSLARRALVAADYPSAARLTTLALRLYPGSADAQALAGTIHLARGETELGVVAFQRAVNCYPHHAELFSALSAALLDASRPIEARDAARRALAVDPRSAAGHLHLANAEEQLGATPAAVEALLRAGLALPASAADQALLRCALAAHLVVEARGGEARLALAGIDALLPACPAPQRAGLHFYLGELLRLSGDLEGARSHFRASETLDPHGRYAAAAWRGARS